MKASLFPATTTTLSFFFLLLLLHTAHSHPHPNPTTLADGSGGGGGGGGGGDLDHFIFPTWTIAGLTGSCTRSSCTLAFDMSSAPTATEPGVSLAHCTVDGDADYWRRCSTNNSSSSGSGSVWTLPVDPTSPFVVSIQHRFVNASASPVRYYNVTGNLSVDLETLVGPAAAHRDANLTVRASQVSEAWYWWRTREVVNGNGNGGDLAAQCSGEGACDRLWDADGVVRRVRYLQAEHRVFTRA